MDESQIRAPIVYVVFNRPRHTRETFAAIRAQRPSQLFIIADGPREGHATDAERCCEVQEIVENIDWPCEVHRDYADQNLGCKQRMISGLNWVFEHVEEAIILEDDCLPHPDFYGYCDVLLDRYRNDDRVMTITGDNFQNGQRRGDASYYFSKYVHVWGWATWRRAWQKNDPALDFWPDWKNSKQWLKHTPDTVERNHWAIIFDQIFRNETGLWDVPWMASVWYHGGLTATPNVNLVTNIGFGPEGTQTVHAEDHDGLPACPLGNLSHLNKIKQDKKADRYDFDYGFGGNRLRFLMRLRIKIAKLRGRCPEKQG